MAAAAWLVLVSGCESAVVGGDAGPPLPGQDAGPTVWHQGVLELGTGAAVFEPVSDGQTLALSRGPQGLQHVYVSLRLYDVDPTLAITELSLTRDRDGVRVNEPFRVRLAYEMQPEGLELIGAQLVTPDEDAAFGESLVLAARVEGRDGSWAEAQASVHVVWEEELRGSP